MCGGQETVKELKLGIEIVRGRFKEIGDSIELYAHIIITPVTLQLV